MSRRKKYKKSNEWQIVFYFIMLIGIGGLLLGIGLPRAEQGIARVTQGKEPVGKVLRYEEGSLYWLGKEYASLGDILREIWSEERQLIPRSR